MKVAVAGGTGTVGAPLVDELVRRGEEVVVLSRSASGTLPAGVTHRRVDLSSGENLAEALSGVEAVVDAANTSPREGEELVAITRRLLGTAAKVGVPHFVGISILGCDRVPTSYYQAKIRQEEEIATGPVPWSILRASQFHELLDWAFGAAARWRLLPTGDARLQPIDVRIVAERLADAVCAEPAGRLPDIAGPEIHTLGDLARTWRAADGRRLLPLRIPAVGKIGRPAGEGALCAPVAAAGGRTFEQWLADG